MDIIKSKLSLVLLEEVSPLLQENSEKITLSTNKDILFILKDKNTNYDFFFRVEKEEVGNNAANVINFTYKPFSTIQKEANSTRMTIPDLCIMLKTWFENIEKYKSIKLIEEDPIEKQYKEEFYSDFKIVDQDAKINSFNFSQQLLLINYLDKIIEHIENDEPELSLPDKDNLIEDAKELKNDISTTTKDEYIKKQSSFWAKVRKKSIKLCEFVLKEFAKEVIKESAKKGMTINWSSLPHYIEQIKLLLN